MTIPSSSCPTGRVANRRQASLPASLRSDRGGRASSDGSGDFSSITGGSRVGQAPERNQSGAGEDGEERDKRNAIARLRVDRHVDGEEVEDEKNRQRDCSPPGPAPHRVRTQHGEQQERALEGHV